MNGVEETVELKPSVLGTKSHWEETYHREKVNHGENPDDEGEVWFGEESEERIIDWMYEHIPRDSALSILDLGTGNGHLLFTLYENGWNEAKLRGIDYAPDAVSLANDIAHKRKMVEIEFEVADFIKNDYAETGWDLITDKGTFDAISLTDEIASTGERLAELFPKQVRKLLKPKYGILLITSCNWTKDELVKKMTTGGLHYHSHIHRPKFSFGGAEGSSVSTVAFVA